MPQATTTAAENVERGLPALLTAVRREASAGEITPCAASAIGQVILSLTTARPQPDDDQPESAVGWTIARRAIAFIDAHLDDPGLSVACIAADSCVSPRHLQRTFASSGTTVTAAIRERRLERAKAHLVSQPDAPISHIAHRWGFADLAHFSRLFKAAYGEAPSVYRRCHVS